MEITEFGMLMLFNPSQPWKALLPMFVTELGMSMVFSPLHQQNAYHSILVTELGMLMVVSLVQPSKALKPIDVMSLGMIVFLQPTTNRLEFVSMMALQLFRESKKGLSLATVMAVSALQLEKA